MATDTNIGVDFSFFTKDEAGKLSSGNEKTEAKSTSKRKKKTLDAPINGVVNTTEPSELEVNYKDSYIGTDNLILATISQVDELASDIKGDIDTVRSSKTLKSKYTYLTNLTSSAASLLKTKIDAVKELNSTITQSHRLELDRMKTVKIDASEGNDDMKMMDLYNAFINMPNGTYNPDVPTFRDITSNIGTKGVMPTMDINPYVANGIDTISPEQNRMRLESNPNIQVVVRYDPNTGQRQFDVIDTSTGMSIPNYPRPDNFLLEETSIDVHTNTARNRNINQVWPLWIEGSNATITEY